MIAALRTRTRAIVILVAVLVGALEWRLLALAPVEQRRVEDVSNRR